MPDLVNSAVFDEAIAEMRRRSKVGLYQRDFDAWAWDVLKMRSYKKLREIAHDALFAPKNHTMAKSGNGVGKTALLAQMVLWAGSVFEEGSTVSIISAPSIPQLQKATFAYLKSYHGRVKADLSDFRIPGHIDENLGWVSETRNGKIWLASGRKPPDQDAVSTFQGIRSQFGMTYVWFDEAGGMSRSMFTAAEAVMTGEASRFFGIGNPDNAGTDFQQDFIDKGKAAEYNLHTISVFDTPVFTGERVYPRTAEGDKLEKQLLTALTSKRWVAHKSRIWATGGVISPDKENPEDETLAMRVPRTVPFKPGDVEHLGKETIKLDGKRVVVIEPVKWDARGLSKVLGEFPGDSDFAFFPQDAINLSTATTIAEDLAIRPVLGVDVARFGSDESVVYLNRGGRARLYDSWAKTDAVESARKIHALAVKSNAAEVRIDASGVGGGVFDMLKVLDEFAGKNYLLFGIDGGERSPDPRRWANIRAYNHEQLREAMQRGQMDLDYDDEELRNQLLNVTFRFSKGRQSIQITPKDEMRTEMGGSPDRLDALIYSVLDTQNFLTAMSGPQPGDFIVEDPWEMETNNSWWMDAYPL